MGWEGLPLGVAATAAGKAKEAYALAQALSSIGTNLSGWNCATGLATTTPPGGVPYTYTNGCYYLVSTIAASGGTNYKPTGTTYTGTASTTVETEDVKLFDMYRYNSEGLWELLPLGGLLSALVHDVQVNGVSKVADTIANILLTDFGITATATELNYMDGVTSNVQTQIDAKCQYTVVTEAPTSLAANTLAILYEADEE